MKSYHVRTSTKKGIESIRGVFIPLEGCDDKLLLDDGTQVEISANFHGTYVT